MIYTKAYLLQQVRHYANQLKAGDFGWAEIANLTGFPDETLLDIFNYNNVYDVPTAIAAVQKVVTCLNEDS